MRLTRYTLLITLMLTVFTVHVAAADFGFELSNLGGFVKSDDLDWFTDHKATLWIAIPLDPSNVNQLAIEGSMYAALPAGRDEYSFFADLDLFRFSVQAANTTSSTISFDLGRFPVSDVTGMVLGQNIDGAELHGAFSFGNIDFLAGYTGLLNVRKGGAILSSDDYTDAATSDLYAFGSKRIVGKLTMQFSEAIGVFDLLFEGLGQYDARRFVESKPDETIDTYYGTVSLGGSVSNSLFLSLSGTYQGGVSETAGVKGSENSLIGSVRFDLFPAKGNQVFAQFIYVPAKSDFFNDTFTPISLQGPGSLYTGNYANLMRISGGWYFNPLSSLNFDVGAKAFLQAQTTDTAPDRYSGTEVNAGATAKATSDLRFRLDSLIWLPYKEDMVLQASLRAILNF